MPVDPNDILDKLRRSGHGPGTHARRLLRDIDRALGRPNDPRVVAALATLFAAEMMVFILANSTTGSDAYQQGVEHVVGLLRAADPDTQRPPKAN